MEINGRRKKAGLLHRNIRNEHFILNPRLRLEAHATPPFSA
jgi:hypothetical protein